MDEIANYIGYAVIFILGVALILLSIFFIYATLVAMYRISFRHKTIFFLRRSESKATYKSGILALKYLLKIAPEDCTLKDIGFLLEKFIKTHKIEKEV